MARFACGYIVQVDSTRKRKRSAEVDLAKVEVAKEILGTRTLADTIDAALSEIVKREQRRKLLELLWIPGALELDDPVVMAGAWS